MDDKLMKLYNELCGIKREEENNNKCIHNYIITNEGFKACEICGETSFINNFTNDNIKDTIYKKKIFYKRIYHINEQIRNLECRIPVDNNIIELIKNNLVDNDIYKTIKKLKMPHLYEKINYIEHKIYNKKVLKIDDNTRYKIFKLYFLIEKEYNNINKSKRKRFLLINFVFYKIFQNLEIENYINLINRKKINDKNLIWDDIKNKLNLKF